MNRLNEEQVLLRIYQFIGAKLNSKSISKFIAFCLDSHLKT